MAEQEQVEPETGAEPLELDEYGRMVAAINRRWPEPAFTWRAHFTPATAGRPCGAHLEVRETEPAPDANGGALYTAEAAGDTPEQSYAALRRLVETVRGSREQLDGSA